MDTLIQDVKFALRMMARNPGFLAAAVLCLMLGIGATSGIFSVVNAVLLRPLPYKSPEQLARIYTEFPTFPNGGLHRFTISGPEYFDLKRDLKSWETIEAWFTGGANLAGDNEAVRATTTFVSGGVLDTLGVPPAMGRAITPADDAPGAPLVADISYGLWQRMFGGTAGIVGRDTFLNGRKCTIVGVMPRGFAYPPGLPEPADVWTPLQIDPANPGGRGSHNYNALGRLKPGVTIAQAQGELDSYVKGISDVGGSKVHRFDTKNHNMVTFVLQAEIVQSVRPALIMLLGAVAFVLLIGCVNVANLLLARAEARRREISIRSAMGAGTARLARQFATEGVLLSLMGGLLGLLLAYGGLRLIVLTNAGSIPRADEISLDWRVVLFTLGTSVFTGILFGFAPLLGMHAESVTDSLKETAGSSTGTGAAQMFRRFLVAGELALALVLLIGCGLMIRAFWKLQDVHTGLDPHNVVTMRITPPRATYPKNENLDSLWKRLEGRLTNLPGVQAAGLANGLPPVRGANMNDTMIEGFVPVPGGPIQNVDFWQVVNNDYFRAAGIRLLDGRLFDDRDGPTSTEVAIVNQTMAMTFWPHESPVGRRIKTNSTWITVVGVVEDAKNAGLDKPAGTEAYFPYGQPTGSGTRSMYVVLRGKSDPQPLVSDVRHIVSELDSSIPVSSVMLMEDVLASAQARPRFLALLLTLFSGVALAIATVGIYGVISYSVARRSKEFGLRMALGARPLDVLSLVMRQGAALALAGVAAGVVAALALTRLMSTLLFGIAPTDPPTFVAIPLLLSAVALLATYIPARRATRVDPMQSLRYE
jgi:predicted permease